MNQKEVFEKLDAFDNKVKTIGNSIKDLKKELIELDLMIFENHMLRLNYLKCKTLVAHDFPDVKDTSKCNWCGITVIEAVKKEGYKSVHDWFSASFGKSSKQVK